MNDVARASKHAAPCMHCLLFTIETYLHTYPSLSFRIYPERYGPFTVSIVLFHSILFPLFSSFHPILLFPNLYIFSPYVLTTLSCYRRTQLRVSSTNTFYLYISFYLLLIYY